MKQHLIGLVALFSLLCLLMGAAAPNQESGINVAGAQWRIRIHEAAVSPDETVKLRDIAELHGDAPPGVWEKLADRALWPAPPELGKPLQINRSRLSKALRESLGEVADLCLLPSSIAIQRGGSVLREEDLRGLVVKELTPLARKLRGEAEFTDFRLPPYAFLAHPGQTVTLEPVKLEPGRLSLRFSVNEVDGSLIRKFTGTVMLNLWTEVPCAAVALNRGDSVGPEQITWIRKNMAYLRGDLWDGRGGPWQVQRIVTPGQPLYVNDLAPLSVVKKGAIVNLIYNKGSVRLSAKAEALADGGPGSTIAVRNLQSKKQIYAVVRDADTVEVK